MAQSPYRERILEHYQNPRHQGKLEKPDRVGEADNPICGDRVRIELGLDQSGRVTRVAFDGDGCIICLAAASMLTEHVLGMSEPELRAFGQDELLALLGVELSPARIQCAKVALQALEAALATG